MLWSFLWCLTGLSVGWALITVHQKLRARIAQAEENVESKWVLVARRLFSLKGIHGMVMTVSWLNIAGRLFVTNPVENFQCYTYPVYKQVTNNQHVYDPAVPFTRVPIVSAEYDRAPWAYSESKWAAMMSLGVFAGAMLVGFLLRWGYQ